MSSAPRSQNWWAATPAAGRRGIIGGAFLVIALLIVSAFVWASPGGATPPPGLDAQLAASQDENASLQEKLDAAESQLEAANRATPSPTPTPTPVPMPTPTPTVVPEEPVAPESETIIVYRDADSEAQPRPPAPAPPPVTTVPPPEPVTAPDIASILSPEQRYFGMYTAQAPFNFATFDEAALQAGSRQSLVGYFGGWDQTFRGDVVTSAWERGLVPMLTWESRPIDAPNDQSELPEYALPRIIEGDFDEYIRQYARDIVATGLPLAIRLDHEMNGTWYPWSEQRTDGTSLNGNGPGDFVTMWQHVHDIFEAEGAGDLVIWTWAPNIVNNLPSRHQDISYLQSLYPGDEYVDLVGVSGYLRSPFKEENNFTFDYTFDAILEQLRAITDKPLIIAEAGATEVGGNKPQWVASMFDAFAQPKNDDLIGFAWFNLAVTTISGGERVTNDWRINSRADSLAAFQEGLADPVSRFQIIPY
ncbi:glycoside hydrolase family 26 protein [Microbacterium murale]|uniref:Mannan endo-1,4-beta-mannosidase n=1 Tax=Microbacterium murale TaxID=1081040 RepID=A0ABU0P9L7_9MICO|nr:glycosyl hydrolase [Microbacterium murale]MDQ0644026.1 mannan endo-1,4-beta-mannosidase [Microbacterium murale]